MLPIVILQVSAEAVRLVEEEVEEQGDTDPVWFNGCKALVETPVIMKSCSLQSLDLHIAQSW